MILVMMLIACVNAECHIKEVAQNTCEEFCESNDGMSQMTCEVDLVLGGTRQVNCVCNNNGTSIVYSPYKTVTENHAYRQQETP